MNFFMLRLPGSGKIISGASERIITIPAGSSDTPLDLPEGFIFAPFGENREILMIPGDISGLTRSRTDAFTAENDAVSARTRPLPDFGTSRMTHLKAVRSMQERVRELERITDRHSKIIAARTAIADGIRCPTDIFKCLCDRYPDACIFLFSTPFSGTWTGASPELLLDADGRGVRSVALAGTRPRSGENGSDMPWDAKNSEEQAIVTEFILSEMKAEGLSPRAGFPSTFAAGPVEHLCTSIRANFPESGSNGNQDKALSLLRRLSPTPALCGFPREEALKAIKHIEGFDREYYGGFVGLLSPASGRLTAYVNLRSCRCDSNTGRALLFAGGGITRASVPEEEWLETERKLSTLLPIME